MPQGLLRTADMPAGRDHAEAEQRFFQAAARLVPGCTPRCLGWAESPAGYVYAPPLALTPESSLALGSWRRSDPLAFATAVARLWGRFTEAGLALGFYHASTLAFRVRLASGGAPGALKAVAVAAPLGTRLDETYRRSVGELTLFPPFERLGGVRLPPAQAEGGVALPETEAAAAALYQLDLLATRPLPIPAGVPWDEVVDMLAAAPPDRFHAPDLAEQLVRALRAPGRVTDPARVSAKPASDPRSATRNPPHNRYPPETQIRSIGTVTGHCAGTPRPANRGCARQGGPPSPRRRLCDFPAANSVAPAGGQHRSLDNNNARMRGASGGLPDRHPPPTSRAGGVQGEHLLHVAAVGDQAERLDAHPYSAVDGSITTSVPRAMPMGPAA